MHAPLALRPAAFVLWVNRMLAELLLPHWDATSYIATYLSQEALHIGTLSNQLTIV